jgi:hypothetical protein
MSTPVARVSWSFLGAICVALLFNCSHIASEPGPLVMVQRDSCFIGGAATNCFVARQLYKPVPGGVSSLHDWTCTSATMCERTLRVGDRDVLVTLAIQRNAAEVAVRTAERGREPMQNVFAPLAEAMQRAEILAGGLELFSEGAGGSSGPRCSIGCPCGNACISCSKRCTK